MRLAILLFITSISLSGCTDRKTESGNGERPHVPPIVSLCESIDYSDTASLHNDSAMRATVKDIVRFMMKSDSAATARGLEVFFNGIQDDPVALRNASRHAANLLNNPNSPARNETLYLRFLRSLLSLKGLPDDVAARAGDQARKAMLNRPGTRANDFRYIDREGKQSTLHAIKANQTMLVFYDPECPHCPGILKRIADNRKVNAAIEAGMLKVIAVYAEGKRDVWEKKKGDLPANWTVAYDLTGVLDADLYDVPAMPTVYLLDADKHVLVKDMPW